MTITSIVINNSVSNYIISVLRRQIVLMWVYIYGA